MVSFKYCPICAKKLVFPVIDGRKRGLCEACGWIYYKNPLPAVSAVIINAECELLLIKRAVEPYFGEWCLPGGFIEVGETLNEAGARELKEETGLVGDAERVVGAYIQKSDMYGFVLIVGVEYAIINDKLTPGDDALEAQFFHFKDLPNIPLESHMNLIRDFKATM
jgi:8-oxo-dGTP diphosphatase